jgi:hypothetical protein
MELDSKNMKKENKWIKSVVDLGNIKENKKVNFSFTSTVPLDIVMVKPGCASCTQVSAYNKETKSLPVAFKPGKISKHLQKTLGYQEFRKNIIVYYKDGTKEILLFIGRMI